MNKRIWMAATAAIGALLLAACQKGSESTADMKELAAQNAGAKRVAVLSTTGDLARGKNQFVVAFTENGAPVDVGAVTVSSSMAMPGMAPMVAPIELRRAGGIGQYSLTGEFAMSGVWQFEVRWDGPAGQGNTSFGLSVR